MTLTLVPTLTLTPTPHRPTLRQEALNGKLTSLRLDRESWASDLDFDSSVGEAEDVAITVKHTLWYDACPATCNLQPATCNLQP